MKILVDINHPAHVHFFRKPIELLKSWGATVLITSREKDVTSILLAEFGLEHKCLSKVGKNKSMLLIELFSRNYLLKKVVSEEKPDVLTSVGGTFIAHVGFALRVPSLVFYDTENAKFQNAITYPFTTRLYVPECYKGWTPKNTIRYKGYHELSYLHPSSFSPDKESAIKSGIDLNRDNFLIRLVSWQANHDVGEVGWSYSLLEKVIEFLSPLGKVIISTEKELPVCFSEFLYRGKSSSLHNVIAQCRFVIGESATVASEAAVLGVPAIYAAHTGRGYTDEQEARYGLVRNIKSINWMSLKQSMIDLLNEPLNHYAKRRELLLEDNINVGKFVAESILNYSAGQDVSGERY